MYSLMQFVNLIRMKHFIQQLVCVPSLGSQNNAIIGQNSQTASSMAYSFHSILYLVQAPWIGTIQVS